MTGLLMVGPVGRWWILNGYFNLFLAPRISLTSIYRRIALGSRQLVVGNLLDITAAVRS